ncbi:hypothetical protein O0L34_g2406 [Tuta absoluta]|nr:hypothetical protein O0L34_g2406 [Tuta absoluta]
MYMSVREIQRSSLWLAVMEPRWYAPPKMLGEASVDLGTVWDQPNHQVCNKWVQLELPRDTTVNSSVGFLKVDISIIFRGEVQVMPALHCAEKVEEHIMCPEGSEQQRAKYLITIHAGFSLPSCIQSQNDRRYPKLPSTYVRVSFSGLVGKTSVQPHTTEPRYNEQIAMVEMFPNMNQVISLEVCSQDIGFNRVMASTELRLGDIAHDGDNGFLPIFGPSLLHMYGATSVGGMTAENGPYFKGALLVSLKTIVPYYQQNLRTVTVEPVVPVIPDNLWVQKEFCLYCPIFEMSMLDNRTIMKYTGLAMNIGEIPSGKPVDEEYHKTHYTGCLEVIKMKKYGYIEFRRDYPVLQLATQLPDFRFRMYRNNIVQGIISELEFSISDVEKRLQNIEYTAPIELFDDLNNAIDNAVENIHKYLNIVNYYNNSNGSQDSLQQYSTELDYRQLTLQTEEIEKIYNQLIKKSTKDSAASLSQLPSRNGTKENLMGTRRAVKMLLAEVKVLAEHLRSTLHKSLYGWPDLIIWLLNEGSRVAYAKLRLSDILYSVIPVQCGSECGRIQTIYMKPLKCERHSNNSSENCYCITGKVEILLWMGLFKERHDFSKYMPPNYKLTNRDLDMHIKASTMMIACRAYIYRAKLNTERSDTLNNPYNAFVRVNALSHVKDTQAMKMTPTPVWNQVLTIKNFMCTSTKRMLLCPPFVLVEIYDEHSSGNKTDLVGRFQIQPVYDEDPKYVPKLQWYEIYKGAQNTGQLLMSVQFVQVPEQLMKSTYYGSCESSFHAHVPYILENDDGSEIIERLPLSLIPHYVTYK